jgi:hypothetical protein
MASPSGPGTVQITDEVARQRAPLYGPLVADAETAHAVFDADELALITGFIRIERGLLAKHTERVAGLDLPARAPTEPDLPRGRQIRDPPRG